MPFADYRPCGAARELFRRREPEVIISGPAGTGKSRAVLEKIHACAEKYDGCRLLICRKTRASLTNTGLVTYTEIVLPPDSAELNYQGALYHNGSVISFGGLDKASKIMSSEYDLIYVQEATELTEDDWENLTTRLRWGRLPYQQMLADCNPSAPTHWIKRRASSGKLVMLESRHEDNPYLWDGEKWTEKGAAYISKLDGLTGTRLLRLRKGVWAAAEGMVYDRYDAAKHLIDRREIPPSWPRVWAVDFGFTNPFVWQIWALDPDDRMILIREIYRTQRLVQDHAGMIARTCKRDAEPCPVAIVCDHDAEDRATLERYLGMLTIPAYKAVSAGIQAVQTRLKPAGDGKPRLYFMRDALVDRDTELAEAHKPTSTSEEIDGYVWPQSATSGIVGDSPIKRDDHGMDAMRYAVAFVDRLNVDPSTAVQKRSLSRPVRISAF